LMTFAHRISFSMIIVWGFLILSASQSFDELRWVYHGSSFC